MMRINLNLPSFRDNQIQTLKKIVLEVGKRIVRYTITDYLTDPGRPWRKVRARRPHVISRYTRTESGEVAESFVLIPAGGTYWVPVYPRQKIGVVSGRLRASIGSSWQYGVRNLTETQRAIIYEIGTKVQYADALRQRKYDFLALGTERALGDIDTIIAGLDFDV